MENNQLEQTESVDSLVVAVLAGGKSGEREISLASGRGASKALTEAGYTVVMVDPANKEDLELLLQGNVDVAFLCLHGKYGEDGTMQGMLEILGIPYTGSGVWSSALALDKVKAKVFYERAGIRTPASVSLTHIQASDIEGLVETLGTHCVVKPATEGSALGVSIVNNEVDMYEAIEAALAIDTEVLVEQYIAGEEYTVAVLGNEEPYALPVIKIVPTSDFYDFESKYTPGGSQHICPAPLSEEATQRVSEMAIEAHRALGCRGVSRSDFILDEDGEFWILETNTIPGMTETSLLPDAAAAAGISFPKLCRQLIEFAMN